MQALEGKPWATLGFGSTQYPRFCAAADLFAQVAAEAGVQGLLRIGKCDAEGNEEVGFRSWVSSLLHAFRDKGLLLASRCEALDSQVRHMHSKLGGTRRSHVHAPGGNVHKSAAYWGCQCESGVQISVSNAMAKVGPPVFNIVPMPGLKRTKEDITRFSAPVKSVTQLLSNATTTRSTVRIVVDLSELPYLQYSPGDHLVVFAANDPAVRAYAQPCHQAARSLSELLANVTCDCACVCMN